MAFQEIVQFLIDKIRLFLIMTGFAFSGNTPYTHILGYGYYFLIFPLMIFENPFKYRRKWERRGKKARAYRNISITVCILLATIIGYRYFFVPAETSPEAVKLKVLSTGMFSAAQKDGNTDVIPWEPDLWKNPDQEAIDQRVRNLKKLPPLSGKQFVHAAFVNQNSPVSIQSALSHARQIDMAFPDWLSPAESACSVNESVDWNVFETFNKNKTPVLPRFSSASLTWWAADFPDILADKKRSACLIDTLQWHIINRSVKGINIDIPSIGISDRNAYTDWILALTESFHESNLYVVMSVPLNNPAFDYENIGHIADLVVIKAYDEHSIAWEPWPIAGEYWFGKSLDILLQKLPPSKTMVGIGSYGYDWNMTTKTNPEQRDFRKILQLAANTKADIKWDEKSGNNSFSYRASDGSDHEVWFSDAVSVWNQYTSVRQKKLYGVSLSRLGSEDVSIWKFIPPVSSVIVSTQECCATTTQNIPLQGTGRSVQTANKSSWQPILASDNRNVFDMRMLERLPYSENTIGYGTGKAYKILALQQEWLRKLSFRGETVVWSQYVRLPQDLTISHFWKGKTKTVTLAFYGGPDKEHSKHILDMLKKYKVRATFFPTIGQMERYPEVVKREYDDGHLLGSQANWNQNTEKQSLQELDSMERSLKSLLGHRTILAYSPYSDSRTSPADQTQSLYAAGNKWYVFVGSDIDSGDIHSTGASHIADNILSQVRSSDSNVIAMNDGPGDRSQTVQVLEKIIPTLQAEGYSFIAADEMLGVSRDTIMPALSFQERLPILWESFTSTIKIWAWNFLVVLFVVTTIVSVLRIVFLGFFVLRSGKSQKKHFSPRFLKMPPVTILVPAYNEEKVIERTVLWLLSSDYPEFEVLVVDDGSTDSTAECVQKVMETHKNVRLISKKNEGKSLALNIGFREAKYDYIVTVDADTIVLPKTVYYLIEPFSDARVDAVCGNIGVGNVKNILTAFQEVEYVTGQNYDRRAFDALNCISVVPGATGAWKKQKVIDIGGYASDTLVEDADLTLTLLEHGGRIVYAPLARSVTEAPEKVGPLFKQRFRWSYGTFQCFWKHRKTFGKWTLGLIALPNMLLFQVVFPALSPIGDLVLVSAIFFGNLQPILAGYILFFLMDAIISGIAYTLDKKSFANIWVILIQRFFYRQFMYVVTFKSIIAAISGSHHGWNKLERKGTVVVEETAA